MFMLTVILAVRNREYSPVEWKNVNRSSAVNFRRRVDELLHEVQQNCFPLRFNEGLPQYY